MSHKDLLHDPELVGVAPVPPARDIRGGKDFYLGSELTVGHKVGLITDAEIPSDGSHRKDTVKSQMLRKCRRPLRMHDH